MSFKKKKKRTKEREKKKILRNSCLTLVGGLKKMSVLKSKLTEKKQGMSADLKLKKKQDIDVRVGVAWFDKAIFSLQI